MIDVNIDNTLKKVIFFTIAVLIFDSANARKIPGQIVDRQGNTMDVVFNIPFKFLSLKPNFERMQYRIAYYDAMNNKKILKPDEAAEVKFYYNNLEVRMLSRVNSFGAGSLFYSNTHIFLHLKIDGKLKLFNYYYTQSSPGMYNASTGGMTGSYTYSFANYLLQVGDEEVMQPRGLAFRKNMIAYLSDCPEVVRMIENRELRKGDLEIIVREYNTKCSAE